MAGRRVGALTACARVGPGTRARSGSRGRRAASGQPRSAGQRFIRPSAAIRGLCVGRIRLLPAARRGRVVSLSCGNSRFAGRDEGLIAADLFSAASATARRSDRSSASTLAGSRSSVSCSNRWTAAYTRSIRYPVYPHDGDQVSFDLIQHPVGPARRLRQAPRTNAPGGAGSSAKASTARLTAIIPAWSAMKRTKVALRDL